MLNERAPVYLGEREEYIKRCFRFQITPSPRWANANAARTSAGGPDNLGYSGVRAKVHAVEPA